MGARHKNLVLAAMVFAVAMMFIDQTIVVLAIPNLQHDLRLSPTGSQWIVNGYLLSLSALFAIGGRIADLFGRRRTVIAGVVAFALFSALCGATPTGSIGATWIIVFRVLQGASAAFLFPAALAIVVGTYEVGERGKYLAIFFSISGGLTAIGPVAGGYLTEWTWRAIFWINVPVALVAVGLTVLAKPEQTVRRERLDLRGAALVGAGMTLAVLGLQQASAWGWSSPATWACLVVGIGLLAWFVIWELGLTQPLVPIRLFAGRGFAIDNAILFLAVDLLRATVLLRQPVRPDRARGVGGQRRAVPARVLRRLLDRGAVGRTESSTPAAPGRPSRSGVRWRRSASTCGRLSSGSCRSRASGTGLRSPARGWA